MRSRGCSSAATSSTSASRSWRRARDAGIARLADAGVECRVARDGLARVVAVLREQRIGALLHAVAAVEVERPVLGLRRQDLVAARMRQAVRHRERGVDLLGGAAEQPAERLEAGDAVAAPLLGVHAGEVRRRRAALRIGGGCAVVLAACKHGQDPQEAVHCGPQTVARPSPLLNRGSRTSARRAQSDAATRVVASNTRRSSATSEIASASASSGAERRASSRWIVPPRRRSTYATYIPRRAATTTARR